MAEERIAQLEAQAEQLQQSNQQLLLNNQEILNAMRGMQEQLRLLGGNEQGQGSSTAPRYSLKLPKPKAPEEYNPAKKTDVDTWIFNCEQYFSMYNSITEVDQVRIAATYLRGIAATWWQHYLGTSTIPTSTTPWADFTKAVKLRWQPINPIRDARDKP